MRTSQNKPIKKMENITCQFNIADQSYTCSIPYIEPVSYNGENSYFFNYWTSGELMTSILLFLILMFMIFKAGFNFFFPQIIQIKKYRK